MAKRKINDYIFHNGIPYSENLRPNAYWLIQNNVEFIVDEVRAHINVNIAKAGQHTPTDATYTPTTGEMTLTITGHPYKPGDLIKIAEGGITFRCALDDYQTDHPSDQSFYKSSNGDQKFGDYRTQEDS